MTKSGVHLRKERFPNEKKSKLMSIIDGPFEITKKISNNAYKIDLQGNNVIRGMPDTSSLLIIVFIVSVFIWSNRVCQVADSVGTVMSKH